MSKVQQLPPTDQISDPQVRAFCDAPSNAWRLRNGDITTGETERFVTLSEIETTTASVLNSVFGGSTTPGLPTIPTTPGPGNRELIRNLQNSVFNSELFRRLGERVAEIVLPRGFVKFVEGQIEVNLQRLSEMGARVGVAEAAIVDERTVRVTNTTAIASAVNTIWAMFGSSSQAVAQNGQIMTSTVNTAQAVQWTSLRSAVFDSNGNNLVAAVTQNFSTYASALDGKLEAAYTLRVEVDGLVGGFGIIGSAGGASGPRIDFGVRANRFFVAEPGTALVAPFIVENGQVVISTAVIGTGRITVAHIEEVISSVNYVPGAAGWRINSATGAAEFNSVVIRGSSTFQGTAQSGNFVTGDYGVGWRIQSNGDAEFSSVALRSGSWKTTTVVVTVSEDEGGNLSATTASVGFGVLAGGRIPVVSVASTGSNGGAVIKNLTTSGCDVTIVGMIGTGAPTSTDVTVRVSWF